MPILSPLQGLLAWALRTWRSRAKLQCFRAYGASLRQPDCTALLFPCSPSFTLYHAHSFAPSGLDRLRRALRTWRSRAKLQCFRAYGASLRQPDCTALLFPCSPSFTLYHAHSFAPSGLDRLRRALRTWRSRAKLQCFRAYGASLRQPDCAVRLFPCSPSFTMYHAHS